MGSGAASLVGQGREALRAGDWAAASRKFSSALEAEETPEALFGLGEALWWTGEIASAISYRERAYTAFWHLGNVVSAARIALRLCVDYRSNIGNTAASAGWLERASRLVRDHGLEPLEGWVLMVRAFDGTDPVARERWAREAVDLARAAGDLDLELSALSVLGAVLVAQARVAEGVARLDEAMAGSLAQAGASRHTTVFTSCNTIKSCTGCADLGRAAQWVQAADRFMQGYGCAFLYATCRTQYGTVLMATGDWAGAERELRAAVETARASLPVVHAEAVAALAQLRVAQGRLEDAKHLVEGMEAHGSVVPVVARLHLIGGRPAAAAAIGRRWLRQVGGDRLEAGFLVELLGEAALAQGDLDTAAECGRQVAELGGGEDCRILLAIGERLAGRSQAASGDPAAARRHLDTALVAFDELGLIYEVARTRLLLAGVFADDEPEVAEAEARGAFAVFDDLGATRDADAAAALLRTLGAKVARVGRKGLGELTSREREVLTLVSEGLSNPEIAQRLYLSRRTVEHHVGHILSKLGARNRTEAASRFNAGPVTG